MKLLVSLFLFLVAAFALVILCVIGVLPTNYLGGFVVGSFMAGLFFFYANAWHQGAELAKKEPVAVQVSSESAKQEDTQK